MSSKISVIPFDDKKISFSSYTLVHTIYKDPIFELLFTILVYKTTFIYVNVTLFLYYYLFIFKFIIDKYIKM